MPTSALMTADGGQGVRTRRVGAVVRSATPPKLPGVLHDQRARLGPIPPEEAIRLLAFVEHDEQTGAGRTEPGEPRIRRPRARLIAVLHERLRHDAGREEVRDPGGNERADEVALVQADVVVLDAQ